MSTGGRSGTPRARPGRCLLVGLVVASLPLAGCAMSGGHGPRTAAAVAPTTTVYPAADRRPVPDVTATTLDGGSLSVRDLTGSGVVVINVWASWCTSCRAESAAIAAVADELSGQPVQFVGIDEQDSASSARRFLAATGTTYPQLTDPAGDVLHALSSLPQTGIPSTLLLDPEGRMAACVIGPVTQDELRHLIVSLQGAA
jgi:peroxiredoxin